MRPGPGLVVMALAFISGARRGSTSTSTSSKILVTSFSTSSTASSSPLLLTTTTTTTTTLPPTTTSSRTSKSKSVPAEPKSILSIPLPFIDTFFQIPPTPIVITPINTVESGNGEGNDSGGGGLGIQPKKRRRKRRTRKSSKYKTVLKILPTEFDFQHQETEQQSRDIFKLPTIVLPSHLKHQKLQSEHFYKTKSQPLIKNKLTIRRKKRGIKQDSYSGSRAGGGGAIHKEEIQKRASFSSLSSSSLSTSSLSSSSSSSSSSSADEIDINFDTSFFNKNTNNYNNQKGGESNVEEDEVLVEETEDSAEGLIIHYPTQQSTDSSISFNEDEDILALVAEDELISEESFDRLTKLTQNKKINYINEEVDDYSESAVSEQLDSLTSSKSSINSKSSSSSIQHSEGVIISDNRRKKTVSIDSDLIKVAELPQNNLIDENKTKANKDEQHHIALVSKLVVNKNDLVANVKNDNTPSITLLSLVEEIAKTSHKNLTSEVPKRSIIESASPLTRLNPWISACDLAQPGTAPDLQVSFRGLCFIN